MTEKKQILRMSDERQIWFTVFRRVSGHYAEVHISQEITTSRNAASPDSAHEKPNRGMPIYIPPVPNGLPVEIATIPCASPQSLFFFLRHPSYIFSSSSPTQQDTRLPYPRKPPNPKSMRYAGIPV